MTGLLLLALASILICNDASLAHPMRQSTYWQLRQQLMRDEMQRSLGGELHLNSMEVKANRVLMAAKNQEIHDGSIFFSFIIKRARIRDRSWHGQVRDYLCTNVRKRKRRVFPFIIRVICPLRTRSWHEAWPEIRFSTRNGKMSGHISH